MPDNVQTLCPVHFNGSVPLGSTEEVMRALAGALGQRTLRLPDGEVGDKAGWINNQHRVFERSTAFEPYEADADWRTPHKKRRRFRLRAGAGAPKAADIGALGYADWAAESFGVFQKLKRDGAVPAQARLKIAIPSPYDSLNYALDPRNFNAVMPAYERSLAAEISTLAAALPAGEIALQFDVAHEFEALASGDPLFFPISRREIIDLLIRLGRAVPETIELGYHCCYGNYNLRHFVEPKDTGDMVEIMNGVIAELGREVAFIHMPVPHRRSDDAYFEPLREFRPGPTTQLFLGLVHDHDGVPGALKRAAAARKAVAQFGIATECGLSGRTPENIRELLRIHREAAAEIDRMG
jgi:methionine synthase II (cobalamin-independent)